MSRAVDEPELELEVLGDPEPGDARWRAERRWHADAARDELDLV